MDDAAKNTVPVLVPLGIAQKFEALVASYVTLMVNASVSAEQGAATVRTWGSRQNGRPAVGVPMAERIANASGSSTKEKEAREEVLRMLERGLGGEKLEIRTVLGVGDTQMMASELWCANTAWNDYGCSPDDLKAYLKKYIEDERFRKATIPLP